MEDKRRSMVFDYTEPWCARWCVLRLDDVGGEDRYRHRESAALDEMNQLSRQ